MKTRITLAGMACAVLLATPSAQAEMSVNIKRLTMEAALRVAQGALEACRAQGIQISATVVDRSGNTQIVLRDTLAPEITVPISRAKAYTANAFTAATSDLKRLDGTPLANRDDLLIFPGGVLIEGAGSYYGAVGVSGAPDSLVDEGCAKAGVKAIQEDLELG